MPQKKKKKNHLNDLQKKLVVEVVTSGAAELLHQLNKAQLNKAQPTKLYKLIDTLPTKAQWCFNALQGLPESKRIELTALAVAVSRILIELVTLPEPYPQSLLTRRQEANYTVIPGNTRNVSAKLNEILRADGMPELRFVMEGRKKLLEM